MFSFFQKKKSANPASILKTDMHSHLIPGIDDGAKTIEESLEMIRQLVDWGYQKIITTPHIMREYYANTPEIIGSGLETVQAAVLNERIPVIIEAAAEYYLDEHFLKLLEQPANLLTINKKYLLIEFSTFSEPANYLDIIFKINTIGLIPILAHPERYTYLANRLEDFERIKSLGCLFQVNLLSLTGHYGGMQKKLADHLIKSGQVELLGTDLHRPSQLEVIKKAFHSKGYQQFLRNSKAINPML